MLHVILYKGTWAIKRGFIILSELRKIFHLFSNSIDWKILAQGEMRFKKSSKSYSDDQWLLFREKKYDLTWHIYFMF